jgi:hypothetical protein
LEKRSSIPWRSVFDARKRKLRFSLASKFLAVFQDKSIFLKHGEFSYHCPPQKPVVPLSLPLTKRKFKIRELGAM